MKPPIQQGRVVFSKKGRDKGRYFVVLYIVDAEFVMISDGNTRKLDHLKKKRRKHLVSCPYEFPEAAEKAAQGKLLDSDLRRMLWPITSKTQGDQTPNNSREG